MIKYILISVSIVIMVLVGYMQITKNNIQKKKTNAPSRKTTMIKDATILNPQATNIKGTTTLKPEATNMSDTENLEENTNENISNFDKEMARNEKEIIKKYLLEKEILIRAYNGEEELDTSDNTVSNDISFNEDAIITPERLEKVEDESELKVYTEYNPHIGNEDLQMTATLLDEIEASTGLQNVKSIENINELEDESFKPL